ncbi:hypothetical protein [Streptomyces sp. RKAG293]|uniref:hypothetical protein n=1 Tax=Streptomyces sp. RKAG293 TaxID=2893403 RepID=UPI00203434DF|nr:hypothetical protein [Streptomyces sp. RKAG293]MCM2416658.1 hypothetical protein [Streptomyces sp. RKAG293]
MAAAVPEHVTWMSEGHVALAWPTIRATCVHATAEANGVRSRLRSSESIWGATQWRAYHPADVARVAKAINEGTAELKAHWRNDTPESKLLDQRLRRENRPGAIGCALVIVALVIVVFFVVITWNSPGTADPSDWR